MTRRPFWLFYGLALSFSLGVVPSFSEGLSLETAYQTALLRNRAIRPAYAALDNAERARFQTAVLNDRSWDIHRLFPNIKRSDSHHLLRAGDCAIELKEEVRSAYYTLQAAQNNAALTEEMLQASSAALALAVKQREAGNISALETAVLHARFGETELAAQRERTSAEEHKLKLIILMGLNDPEETLWNVETVLPPLPAQETALAAYEKAALSKSLELSAAQAELEVLKGADPVKPIGYIQEVNLGASEEKRRHSLCHQGKVLGMPLYIVGGGAHGKNLHDMLVQAGTDRIPELELSLLSALRRAYARMSVSRKIAAHYRDTLIPQHARIVAETQKLQNFMLAGVYQLLDAKQHELASRKEETAALSAYWVAKAELDRLSGGGP